MDQASELFKANEDHDLLKCLKLGGINGNVKKVDELSVKFEEHREQLEEVQQYFIKNEHDIKRGIIFLCVPATNNTLNDANILSSQKKKSIWYSKCPFSHFTIHSFVHLFCFI